MNRNERISRYDSICALATRAGRAPADEAREASAMHSTLRRAGGAHALFALTVAVAQG